ncbi:MAG: Gfo/Idh/MocA family oxidoreductase [Clostridia bacterium]|nr:Gfo/Idh/MocA family oxidoreductase [Clostridia bacterium]
MNKEKLRIVIVGCGRFCKFFVPLFKAHPVVEKVYVCDIRKERERDYMEKFDVEGYESFEKALADPSINAVAIFTERFRHGQMVIDALKAGKNVYSAVPCAVSIDEMREIAKLVKETRLTYSMGETGVYRAPAMYCRREFKKGTFGKFVYGEAQYNHDIRNMEGSFKSSGGEEHWKEFAGIPPFFYPTHSTSMILSSMPGVYATKVSAMGFAGSPRTDIYGRTGQNYYDNPFSNETMLLHLSNGGVARISENRCVGWMSPETYITQFYGTDGGYEFSVANHHQTHWDPERPGKVIMKCVTDELQPKSIADMIKEDYDVAVQKIADTAGFMETSPVQPTWRLPKEFEGLRNGHNGTHHFLIDDFCRAYATGKLSPTNIWAVARYNIPGLVAHMSAMAGGQLMDVPDLGDPPADWEVLDYES